MFRKNRPLTMAAAAATANNRYIPVGVRAQVPTAVCANSPFNPATGCKDYRCPLWMYNGGRFDEAGFQLDHKIELSHGGENTADNLQALCPSCHAVKTKRCAQQKWDFTSAEIDGGRSHMTIDDSRKKRRKVGL